MMIICELCGSANVETDEHCRVCGQSLKRDVAAVAPAPAFAQAAPTAGNAPSAPTTAAHDVQAGWPAPPAAAADQPAHLMDSSQPSLQMSAYAAPVEASAPPMLGSITEIEQSPIEVDPGSDVPSFMQGGGRSGGAAPEPVQLISANDLPEWLRQIADADTAKAEAEAAALATHTDAPATIVKKVLPGETTGTNRTTNWLSKTTPEEVSPDHWDSSEIANANWGNPDAVAQAPQQAEYPTIVPPTAFVPSSTESYYNTKPKRKLSFSKRASTSSSAGDKPFYRNQTFQLVLLVALVAIFALMIVM